MTEDPIIELYETLSQLPRLKQRMQLGSLSPKAKSALWTYNIQRYLDSHPELDSEAKDFLREIMRLAAKPETFEIGMDSSAFEARQTTFEDYSRRAERLLPRQAIYESIGRLGPEPQSEHT